MILYVCHLWTEKLKWAMIKIKLGYCGKIEMGDGVGGGPEKIKIGDGE